MNKLLAKLPPFALPFVTRSLRGGRGKRYALFSALIAAGTILVGLWIALGSGSFEQSLRVELGLEQDEWQRERQEFVAFAHDPYSAKRDQRAVDRLHREGPFCESSGQYGDVWLIRDEGLALIEDAAWSANARTAEDLALRDRARALISAQPDQVRGYGYFAWSDPQQVARLERVLERGGIPNVRRYASPLGLRESLAIIGFLAAVVLAACVTVFGPLLVGIQQAQEQHENTLTPLTGTGLTARQLALGLAAGPTFAIGIFALPQLFLFGVCVVFAGEVLTGLGLLTALAASGLFVTFAAQLLGHLVGRKRTPGTVAIVMMAMLGIAWLVGAMMATEIGREIAGFAAVLPTMGLSALLAKSFGALGSRYADTTMLATLAWSVAALIYAWLTWTVLAHKIEGRQGAPLARVPALLGALTSIALIHVAMPELHAREKAVILYMGLAGLSVPLTLLLMARVPTGDNPPRMRRVPVLSLLLEFASWGLIHTVLSATLYGLDADALHPIALLWLAWCVGVLGLLAIRVVSLPSSIASHLFVGFCGASLAIGYVQAVVWGMDDNLSMRQVFALAELSPIAGLLQVAVTIGVPILLVRNLRKSLGSLSFSPHAEHETHGA